MPLRAKSESPRGWLLLDIQPTQRAAPFFKVG
jgi:hypothetical protein